MNHKARDYYHRMGQLLKDRVPQFVLTPKANMISIEGKLSNPTIRYFVNNFEINSNLNTLDWWIDSATNEHICNDKNLFSPYQILHQNYKVGR